MDSTPDKDAPKLAKFWKKKTTPEVVEFIEIDGDTVIVDYGIEVFYMLDKDAFFAEWEPVQDDKRADG